MKFVVSIPDDDIRRSFLTEDNLDYLRSVGEVVLNDDPEKQWTEDELAERLRDADACITVWSSPCLTEGALKYADKLKLLINLGGTVAPFVSDAMWDKGVRAMSGNDFFAESVAEGVIGYMLTALRDIPAYMEKFRVEHRWNPKKLSNNGLLDKTVGIISYGAVSHHLVKMLKPFRVKINIYDIVKIPESDLVEYNMTELPIDEVFEKSDIVTVQTPLNPATFHMIGRELLEKLPDGALFINTARGAVVDEEALIGELRKNRFRAFLDVYEKEPPDRDNPLFSLDNVFMMPHKAGPTFDRRKYIARALLEEAAAYLSEGKELTHEISRGTADRMSRS